MLLLFGAGNQFLESPADVGCRMAYPTKERIKRSEFCSFFVRETVFARDGRHVREKVLDHAMHAANALI